MNGINKEGELSQKERLQYSRDIEALENRLNSIDTGIKREKREDTDEVYTISTETRIEAVGFIYLMPENN